MRKQALYKVTIQQTRKPTLVIHNAINVLASTTKPGVLRVFIRNKLGKVTEQQVSDVVVYNVQRQDGFVS